MFQPPDPARAWEYENGFYLTSDPTRLAKALAHYELFKLAYPLPGAIVECGVFKGASLCRFAMFRHLFGPAAVKPIVAFDTFGAFPPATFAGDHPVREQFVAAAGEESISTEALRMILEAKQCGESVELIAGDVCVTAPRYIAEHPEWKIALLNLDTDLYEPAVAILENLYPRLVPGGVLMLDDYGVFPGETAAVDEYFAGQNVLIQRWPFAGTPCYIVKPGG